MRVSAWKWVCEYRDCTYEWLARGEKVPEKCAKCKRRRWHGSVKVQKPKDEPYTLLQVIELTPEQGAILNPGQDPQDLEVDGKATWYPNPRLARLNASKYGKGKR
jgi:hypothetical protein